MDVTFNTLLQENQDENLEYDILFDKNFQCQNYLYEYQSVNLQKHLKIELKFVYEQNDLVAKVKKNETINNNQQAQKQNQQTPSEIELIEYKKEIIFFVNKNYLQLVKFLKDNFCQEEQCVQLVFVCSRYIFQPDLESIVTLLNLLYSGNKNYINKQLKKVLDQTQNFHLLASCCSLQLNDIANEVYLNIIKNAEKKLNINSLVQSLLISIQYDHAEMRKILFTQFREFILYISGVIDSFKFQENKLLIQNTSEYQIEIIGKEIICISSKLEQLKIDTLIFKESLKEFYIKQNESLVPLQKYQQFKVLRKRSQKDALYISENGDYPHYYQLNFDHNNQTVMTAQQTDVHSEILIFFSQNKDNTKYDQNYAGKVERNYWGTVFSVYDHGLPEFCLNKIPNYFSQPQKKILEIIYDTNVMAQAPRKFTGDVWNYETKKFIKVKSLEPIYNEKLKCYQLNFYGRASKASARNFEVIPPDDDNTIYLLHGKESKNHFNLDFRHPFNILQAFSFSLCSISKKFLVA